MEGLREPASLVHGWGRLAGVGQLTLEVVGGGGASRGFLPTESPQAHWLGRDATGSVLPAPVSLPS